MNNLTDMKYQYYQPNTVCIPNKLYPKLGSSDEKCAQLIRNVALKMARLDIDKTDVAFMAAVLLMSPGRYYYCLMTIVICLI